MRRNPLKPVAMQISVLLLSNHFEAQLQTGDEFWYRCARSYTIASSTRTSKGQPVSSRAVHRPGLHMHNLSRSHRTQKCTTKYAHGTKRRSSTARDEKKMIDLSSSWLR